MACSCSAVRRRPRQATDLAQPRFDGWPAPGLEQVDGSAYRRIAEPRHLDDLHDADAALMQSHHPVCAFIQAFQDWLRASSLSMTNRPA